MAGNYTLFPNPSGSNASVGLDGATAPTSATEIGGIDGTGKLRGVSVDASGNVNVNVENFPGGTLDVNLTKVGGSAITEGQKAMASSLPVVIASDQSNINVVQPDVVATGSITSTQAVVLNVNGLGSAGIQITGTWTGFISFSASVDGTNFSATSALVLSTGAIVGAVTGNGIWTIQCTGMQKIAVTGTSVATGTAVVTIRGNQAVSSVMLDNPIPAGTNTIGAVNQNGTWSTRTQDGSGTAITSTASALDVNLKSSTGLGTITTSDLADGSVSGGTAGTKSMLAGGQFNTSFPTLTNGQQSAIQLDSSGRQVIAPLASTSTVTVVQPTGTNLHAVLDSGSTTTVTQSTASSLNATVVQGTASNLLAQVSQPTASSLNATVVQATGTNLHTVVDSGTITTVSTVTSITNTVTTSEVASGTATLTNVASSASSVSILASNANRKNACFFNDSTQILYLKFGTTASSSSYTVQLQPNQYYELPAGKIYTGAIDGIWASANGNLRVTELT